MTSTVKHTPGPWRASGDEVLAGNERPLTIAICDGGPRRNNVPSLEACDNAHLIAAAPDLLAALREALYFGIGSGMFGEASFSPKGREITNRIRAAIAKAEGR